MDFKDRYSIHPADEREAAEAAKLEAICFPPGVADTQEDVLRRYHKAPEYFYVARDLKDGRIAGMLNGILTDETAFRDEFFTDPELHSENGRNVMLLGLEVHPDYRKLGIARALMETLLYDERMQGRRTAVLTCLPDKVEMYRNMGFADRGISGSSWGGEQWHEMVYVLNDSKKQYDIICAGMALIDSIVRGFDPTPVSASGYRAQEGELHIGGEAVNEAMAAAKLGMKTGILCHLGKDAAGEMVMSALEGCGVRTDLVVRSEDHPTPVTTMLVNEDGSRMSVTNRSHKYNFHPERYLDRLADTRALILGSLFRAPFDDATIIHSILTEAKRNQITVFADTKIPNFKDLNLSDIADSLPLIDYITPNEDEAKFYTGKEEPAEMAEVFLDAGVKNVIITLGANGCFFMNRECAIRLPAYEIRAVDATGAGDNFIAGFASEILRGQSVEEALRFGNACGAICTTAIGAGTALQNRPY